MQLTTLALAALAGVASAQQAGTKMIVVTVGANNSQIYSPENIRAAVGDVVQFQFPYGNHTVTQSTFDQPCQPISMNSNVTGFHSGFQPAAASQAQGMTSTFSIMINNTNPIWVYCAQGKHCENGMALVINENTAANPPKTLAAYKAAAVKANTVVPGAGGSTGGTNGNNGGNGGNNGGNGDGTNVNGAMAVAAPTFSVLAIVGALLML